MTAWWAWSSYWSALSQWRACPSAWSRCPSVSTRVTSWRAAVTKDAWAASTGDDGPVLVEVFGKEGSVVAAEGGVEIACLYGYFEVDDVDVHGCGVETDRGTVGDHASAEDATHCARAALRVWRRVDRASRGRQATTGRSVVLGARATRQLRRGACRADGHVANPNLDSSATS